MSIPEDPVDWSKLKSFRDLRTLQPMQQSRGNRYSIPKHLIRREDNGITRTKSLSANLNKMNAEPKSKVTQCKRTITTNIKGKKIDFQYYNDSNPLFHAKIKPSKNPEFIKISEGDTSHISGDDYQYSLMIGNSFCDFSLRKGDVSGDELMTVQIRLTEYELPRSMKVYFFNQDKQLSPVLQTRMPVLKDGQWMVSLGSKDVIASIKNVCLEDKDKQPLIIVRKIAEDTLEIEAFNIIPDILLFGISMASFLCKI